MSKFLMTLIALAPGLCFAATLEFTAELLVGGELTEINERQVKAEGWRKSENDLGDEIYVLSKTLESADLPAQFTVGDATLTISKDGLVRLAMTVGDADAGCEAALRLPTENGRLLPLPAPLVLEGSGGDHASGTWMLDGKVKIKVK